MLVIVSLPKAPYEPAFSVFIGSDRFLSANDTSQRRGDPCGRPPTLGSADKVDMIWHHNETVKRDTVQCLYGTKRSLCYCSLRCQPQFRATARVAPTDRRENAAPILRADCNEISTRSAVIIFWKADLLSARMLKSFVFLHASHSDPAIIFTQRRPRDAHAFPNSLIHPSSARSKMPPPQGRRTFRKPPRIGPCPKESHNASGSFWKPSPSRSSPPHQREARWFLSQSCAHRRGSGLCTTQGRYCSHFPARLP